MRLTSFKELMRLEQTFFGLPFVLAAVLLGSPHFFEGRALLWILSAFMLARMAGMAFNQLIDCVFDAKNPRTEKRVIPAGKVSMRQARIVAWGALGLFVLVCLQINGLTALLSLFAAILLYVYSYTKRVHAACHFILGCIHFLAPLMAYSAQTGTWSCAALFLGAAAACSIVGTDIVYAIQDYAFDCAHGLFSLPSRIGVTKSLSISFCSHFFCVLMLGCVGVVARLPLIYYLIIPCVGVILEYFQYRVHVQWYAGKPLTHLATYFFYANVAVSTSTLFWVTVSKVWGVL